MAEKAPGVVEKVHKVFMDRGLTLSAAESCTGGLVSHYITALEGASAFFKAAIVAYSEEAKKALLGVSAATIKRHGQVSVETAREMAERVRLITGTDFSVSTTGNLGPGTLEYKEKGLVYIAASRKGGTISRELKLTGGRAENKETAALSALELLIELVMGSF